MALLANPVEWTEDAHNGKLQASPSADSPVLYRVREPLEAASSTLLHQLWPPTGLRGGVFRPSLLHCCISFMKSTGQRPRPLRPLH
mmetsp:Transcript_47684/g.111651  ORF Transcript_47684/g.111651 Transcript_47684/m.111651 type:complete len:86 (+) Transcript_47684:597-854(+)